jgi:4-amino-4-deoxy-L-arabinose transferase-like glycosyltransferase
VRERKSAFTEARRSRVSALLGRPGPAGADAFLLFGLSLATKVPLAVWVWLRDPTRFVQPDSRAYSRLALDLVNTGHLGVGPAEAHTVAALRTPGYPLLLAGVYALFGASPLPAVLLQCLLASLTVVFAYQLGCRVFSRSVGLVAAIALCLDFASISLSLNLMSETTFALLLVVALLLLVRGVEADRPWWPLFGSGTALACATLVRPFACFSFVPAAAVLFLFLVRPHAGPCDGRLRRAASGTLAFLLMPVLLVGGYNCLAVRTLGLPPANATNQFNTYFVGAAGVDALKRSVPLAEAQFELGLDSRTGDYSEYVRRNPDADRRGLESLGPRWQRDGLVAMARHPWTSVFIVARSTFIFFLDPASFELCRLVGLANDDCGAGLLYLLQSSPACVPGTLWRRYRGLLLLSLPGLMLTVASLGGLAIWLVRSRRNWNRARVLCGLVMLYLVLFSSTPVARARFRVPAAPFLLAFAAAGWLPLLRHRGSSGAIEDL